MMQQGAFKHAWRAAALCCVGLGAVLVFVHATDFEPAAPPVSIDQPSAMAEDARPAPVRVAAFTIDADADEGSLEETAPILSVRPIDPQPSAAGLRSAPMPPYVLVIPVEGVGTDELFDSFSDARGAARRHLAIDIMAPTGTPVVAAAAGEIVRLHHSPRGGITVYIVDEAREFIYYYAHLDGYAEGLVQGQTVDQGDHIGYVGHTGNADASTPHLHFAIWKKRPGRSFWGGSPVNPYLALTR